MLKIYIPLYQEEQTLLKFLIKATMKLPMTISSMMNGEYGLNDVCLSHLFVLCMDGVKGCVTPTLLDSEVELMHKSGNVLKDMISKLQF